MGLICYQHNGNLVTKAVRLQCALYIAEQLRIDAPERKQGKSSALAAELVGGISPRTLERFARRVRDNPTLLADIQSGTATLDKQPSARVGYDRYAQGWESIRNSILARDSNRCAICGKLSVDNSVHHVDANKHNNEGSNLITLCYDHHAVTIAHPEGELNQVCKFLAGLRHKEDTRYE